MATFRRACSKIIEKGDESEKDKCYTQTVGEDDQENSFDRTSETDEEADEDSCKTDQISDQDSWQELHAQGSVTLKRKKKAG